MCDKAALEKQLKREAKVRLQKELEELKQRMTKVCTTASVAEGGYQMVMWHAEGDDVMLWVAKGDNPPSQLAWYSVINLMIPHSLMELHSCTSVSSVFVS